MSKRAGPPPKDERPAASPARERLSAAVRRVAHVLADRDATEEQINGWAAMVEELQSRIHDRPPESVIWGLGANGLIAIAGVPAAGEVVSWVAPEQGHVRADVVYGRATRGHEQYAHGGSIAATFDEVCGMLWTFTPGTVFTANLEVRYAAPVPLGDTIVFEARESAREGNKREVMATAHNGNRLCAEARLTFVHRATAPPVESV